MKIKNVLNTCASACIDMAVVAIIRHTLRAYILKEDPVTSKQGSKHA